MFRVAMSLGRTVEELMNTMSSTEWTGWQCFTACEPFGPFYDDQRIAGVIAAVYRSQGVAVDSRTYAQSVPPRAKKSVRADDENLRAWIVARCPGMRGQKETR